jgi:thiol-disulfide isomerase/thioredoxin
MRLINRLLIFSALFIFSWTTNPFTYAANSNDPFKALNLAHGKDFIPEDLVLTSGPIQTSNLSHFLGQKIIIHFWDLYCQACESEWKDVESLERSAKLEKIQFLLIFGGDPDEEPQARKFLSSLPTTFDYWVAAPGESRDEFLRYGIPMTYFVASNGKVIARTIGTPHWSSNKNLAHLLSKLFWKQ